MAEVWPLFDLVIRTPDLLLRPLREADALSLAERLPPDLELDPALPRFALREERQVRAAIAMQGYWRAYGSWSVENWNLPFGVWQGETLIGSQSLEGEQFLAKRVLDTSSYLLPAWRGTGLGKQMRRGVLALGFGELGAEWAVSSAWTDNAPSLGVSRAVGYEPNGLSRHVYFGRLGVFQHVLLTRERWEATDGAAGISVSGFDPCGGLFGLAGT